MELIKRRKLSDFLMLSYIVVTPHSKKPDQLIKMLKTELDKLENNDIMNIDAKPEKGAFDKIRKILNK